MSGTMMGVAGQACLQHCVGTQLSVAGFFWLGLVNLVMLLGFLVASMHRDSPADDAHGANNTPRSTGDAPRASDAEREATATAVSKAIAAGRLGLEEGVGRVDAAYRAHDRQRLDELVADLPLEPLHRGDHMTHPARAERILWDVGVVAVVASALLQALTGLWELWPFTVAALAPLAFLRRREAGSATSSPSQVAPRIAGEDHRHTPARLRPPPPSS